MERSQIQILPSMGDDELLKLYGAGAWDWEGTWSLMVRTPGKSAILVMGNVHLEEFATLSSLFFFPSPHLSAFFSWSLGVQIYF